nr:MAG TPA: hypothetical protein [Caudoviricetes sp.]
MYISVFSALCRCRNMTKYKNKIFLKLWMI